MRPLSLQPGVRLRGLRLGLLGREEEEGGEGAGGQGEGRGHHIQQQIQRGRGGGLQPPPRRIPGNTHVRSILYSAPIRLSLSDVILLTALLWLWIQTGSG